METTERPKWARLVPEDGAQAFGVTLVISTVIGIVLILLVTTVFREYGLTLFVAVPFATGMWAPLFYGLGAPRRFRELFGVSLMAQLTLFIGVLFFAIEGLICIAMAMPIWLVFATIGACVAYPIHRELWRNSYMGRGFPVGMLLMLMMIPMLAGAERLRGEDAPLLTVATTVEIDAPPAVVWAHLVEFPDMPRPKQWPFRVGIAYPIRAELRGRGVGATRYCVFSTGRAEEPVRVWEEGKVLDIDVVTTPPPMLEWSPFSWIHPPHLDGYLVSERARFELTALPGGRTRLVGRSWYRNRIYPVAYWRLWSDEIIHELHVAVLSSIKERSEAAARRSAGGVP